MATADAIYQEWRLSWAAQRCSIVSDANSMRRLGEVSLMTDIGSLTEFKRNSTEAIRCVDVVRAGSLRF